MHDGEANQSPSGVEMTTTFGRIMVSVIFYYGLSSLFGIGFLAGSITKEIVGLYENP